MITFTCTVDLTLLLQFPQLLLLTATVLLVVSCFRWLAIIAS